MHITKTACLHLFAIVFQLIVGGPGTNSFELHNCPLGRLLAPEFELSDNEFEEEITIVFDS